MGIRNDTLLGHVIVLLQFGWPREEGTFYELLDKIRDQGGLKYRVFFNYVNNILFLTFLELFCVYCMSAPVQLTAVTMG